MTVQRMLTVPYPTTGLAASIGYQLLDATTHAPIGDRVAGEVATEDGATGLYVVLVEFDTDDGLVQHVRVDKGAGANDVLGIFEINIATAATADDVTNAKEAIIAAIGGGGGGGVAGPGASANTLRVLVEGQPVADADVWVTSDAAGVHVVAGTLQTNSEGKVTFLLDEDVTYYLWAQKDGVNSIRGQAFVAEAE